MRIILEYLDYTKYEKFLNRLSKFPVINYDEYHNLTHSENSLEKFTDKETELIRKYFDWPTFGSYNCCVSHKPNINITKIKDEYYLASISFIGHYQVGGNVSIIFKLDQMNDLKEFLECITGIGGWYDKVLKPFIILMDKH